MLMSDLKGYKKTKTSVYTFCVFYALSSEISIAPEPIKKDRAQKMHLKSQCLRQARLSRNNQYVDLTRYCAIYSLKLTKL